MEAPGLRIKARNSARPLHFASVPKFSHGWPHRPQRSAWVRGFALQAADKNPVSTRGTGRASLLDMTPFGLAHVACGDVLSLPVSQRMIHFCPYARRGGSARPQVVGTYIAKAVGGMPKCNPAPAPWGSAVSPNERRPGKPRAAVARFMPGIRYARPGPSRCHPPRRATSSLLSRPPTSLGMSAAGEAHVQ